MGFQGLIFSISYQWAEHKIIPICQYELSKILRSKNQLEDCNPFQCWVQIWFGQILIREKCPLPCSQRFSFSGSLVSFLILKLTATIKGEKILIGDLKEHNSVRRVTLYCSHLVLGKGINIVSRLIGFNIQTV